MNSTLDLTDKRFGALTVIARAGISKHRGKITRGKNSEKEKKNADIETETI